MKNLTIKARLYCAMGCLALLLVATGSMALLGLKTNNDIFRAVYDDRLVALGQLDQIMRSILRNQIELGHASVNDPAAISTHLKKIADNLTLADEQWASYTTTGTTAEERVVQDKFLAAQQRFLADGLMPAVKRLQEKNQRGAQELSLGAASSLVMPVREAMNELINLQLAVGRQEYQHAQTTYERFRIFSFAAILLGIVIALGMGFWLTRSISQPLQDAVRMSNAISSGDLTQKIEVTSKDETGKLQEALRDMHGSLQHIVGQVRSGTDTIAIATGEIATGNLDLSVRTEQQAAALEKTTAAMDELTSTVKQNSENARQANQLALSASAVASEGAVVVTKVVETMSAINEASQKIVNIIAVIDSIAFQTNILASNAAVEAARAGEQGRGFAVVATEVRNLARRSADAAKEIKALINDSVGKVSEGSELVNQAGATMEGILSSVKRVTTIMSEISQASNEQEVGIGQIHHAIAEMDSSTQQNAALVEQATAAATSLKEQAAGLSKVVSVFRLERKSQTLALSAGASMMKTEQMPVPTSKLANTPRINPKKKVIPSTPGANPGTNAAEQWDEF
jgi:methyl-accepting chemotaxis protein